MSDRTGMGADRESGASGSRAEVGLRAETERSAERVRLLALRDFAYGASHELNNPLANIVSRAESLLRDEDDAERRRKLAAIISQAYRAHEMIADLMLYARPPALKLAPVRAGELLASVVQELRDEADELEVALVVSSEPTLTFPGDADQLASALRAVGRNALEASVPGGRVEFSACSLASDSDQQSPAIQIRVTDNGRGFAPEARERLFHPYYSGREAGRGLGLGLSKAWRIVDEHGGAIDLARTLKNETQVTINLPRS